MPLHPQSDGIVGRFYRTILNDHSFMVSKNHQDWENFWFQAYWFLHTPVPACKLQSCPWDWRIYFITDAFPSWTSRSLWSPIRSPFQMCLHCQRHTCRISRLGLNTFTNLLGFLLVINIGSQVLVDFDWQLIAAFCLNESDILRSRYWNLFRSFTRNFNFREVGISYLIFTWTWMHFETSEICL